MIKVAGLLRITACVTVLLTTIAVNALTGTAQQPYGWAPQQTIPDYDPETEPPCLIADRNRTVHAFSYQYLGEDRGQPERAIMYNRWTLEGGWTPPIDILLSSIKGDARLLGATLDQTGMMHVFFFGGDDTGANVYYSQALGVSADRATAWSEPLLLGERAITPQNGGLAGDDKGNLVAVYSGDLQGHGFYSIHSGDGGETWSEPELMFATYDQQVWPFYLRMHLGESGWLHAVWTANDIQNHGQALYYARFSFVDMQWSDPMTLAENQGGLGTQAPTVIEYHDSLIVMYYGGDTNKQHMIRSFDGGRTWTAPVAPFPHVGLNGPGFFVVDANDDLHLFWGQRITGSPDMHGMWHSVWQDGGWGGYEAVVSGPKVLDRVGFSAFDPVTASAASRQGNVLLVTWRSDPGSRGNGVWYSYQILDAPELSLTPLPTPATMAEPTPLATAAAPAPTLTPPHLPSLIDPGEMMTGSSNSPAVPLVFATVLVMLLLSVVTVMRWFSHRGRL